MKRGSSITPRDIFNYDMMMSFIRIKFTDGSFIIILCELNIRQVLIGNGISRWGEYTVIINNLALFCRKRIKGPLSGLRPFLAAESALKMIKSAFYLTSKALFFLSIFKFFSWRFGHVAKRLDKKEKVNFKFYDSTAWLTNNCNTHIVQYIEK